MTTGKISLSELDALFKATFQDKIKELFRLTNFCSNYCVINVAGKDVSLWNYANNNYWIKR